MLARPPIASALMPSQQRCPADRRRFPHDDKPGLLQVFDKPLGHDARHELARVIHALAALEPEREGQSVCQVFRRGGAQVVGRVGHRSTIAEARERIKNKNRRLADGPRGGEAATSMLSRDR